MKEKTGMEIIQKDCPNGLKAILVPMRGTETIAEVLAVRAGWKYETSEDQGLSHFLEHMAFKGTLKHPKVIDIFREIDFMGANNNASTSEEMINYWFQADSKHFSRINNLLFEMVLEPYLDPEEIARESGTIIQELRMYQDVPQAYVGLILWPRLLYGDQPAGRLAIGSESDIKSLRREHFVDYMKKLYVAGNMTVCLAGRIPNPDKAYLGIAQAFGSVSRDPVGLFKPPVVDNQDAPALSLEHREIEQSHIILGVRAYDITHSDHHVLEVMFNLLGGYMSSRMFMEVRERRGLAYYISTALDCQTDVGSLVTCAGLAREKMLEGVRVILDQYRAVADGEITEDELELAKSNIGGCQKLAMESSIGIAAGLARKFALTGKVEKPEETIKKIQAVTLSDLERVGRDIFADNRLNLAIVGPHGGMEEEILKILKF